MALEIRFANFHGKLPRCEIDALWEIIAYCSEAESKTESKSHSRWELLSFLLSRGAGVLSESDMLMKNDVPSNDQLALCAKELNQLSELLRRGFLDDLPSSDTFLIKTIEKSLALQADASVPLEGDRSRCDLKMLSQEVHKFWEATNLCKKYDVHVAPTTVSTLVEYIGPSDNSIACLLPYNLIATNCLRLLGFWMDHVPAKRARWLRLLRAIESLVSKAQSISQMGSGGDVFPTATLTNPRNNCKLLVYGEAATYISILSAVFCALRAASKDDEIYQSKSFSELVCRTVRPELLIFWKMGANSFMLLSSNLASSNRCGPMSQMIIYNGNRNGSWRGPNIQQQAENMAGMQWISWLRRRLWRY